MCGQHDRVCDIVYFDRHQHFGILFTNHDLRTDTRSRWLCAGVSESRCEVTYRLDDNTLKSAGSADRLTFGRRKIANRDTFHSLSQSSVS